MIKFLPDIYVKSIYNINYENLKLAGIKVLLFDLDNTLVPLNTNEPSNKVMLLFDDIKALGIKPVIISNRNMKRIAPFKEKLCVDAACNAMKPLSKKYKKIQKLYNVKPNEMAAIGDQILSDVVGANNMGITSILVNPISSTDLKITKIISRSIESLIIKYYTNKDVFKKGEYYE